MLKDKCYEWFNATHREAWNDWSPEAAAQEVANWQDGEKPDPDELYEIMLDIINEYDRLSDPTTLYKITGQESGIVIYDDKVIVANWSSYDSGLPVLSPFGDIMEWPESEPIKVIKEYPIDDIRDAIPGEIVEIDNEEGPTIGAQCMDIVSDEHGDIPALWGYVTGDAYVNIGSDGNLAPTSGNVYIIQYSGGEATVIAPDGWN